MREPLLLIALAFIAVVPWGGRVVQALLRYGIGKHIRVDGPVSHQGKSGTATMGGLYILAAMVVLTLLLAFSGYRQGLLPLVAMVAFGLLGAFDDLQGLKDAAGVGWLARWKFLWQWVVGLVLALLFYVAGGTHILVWPVSAGTLNLGTWYLPLATLWLVWASNAVNLTDGLDGLAAGTAAIASLAFGVVCLLNHQAGLGYFCFILVGVTLAFLWYNVNPARMFMGDTGSQALGAGLAAVAVLSGQWLLLPLIGIVYAAVSLSVVLQVSYFKYTRHKYGEGRRILRMAPLHHHFEQIGWPEVQITLRFWIVAVVAAVLGVALAGVR